MKSKTTATTKQTKLVSDGAGLQTLCLIPKSVIIPVAGSHSKNSLIELKCVSWRGDDCIPILFCMITWPCTWFAYQRAMQLSFSAVPWIISHCIYYASADCQEARCSSFDLYLFCSCIAHAIKWSVGTHNIYSFMIQAILILLRAESSGWLCILAWRSYSMKHQPVLTFALWKH